MTRPSYLSRWLGASEERTEPYMKYGEGVLQLGNTARGQEHWRVSQPGEQVSAIRRS